MHDRGKSDGPVLPAKPSSNNATSVAAEVVEGRGTVRERGQRIHAPDAEPEAASVSRSELERVRRVVRVLDKDVRFTALLHRVTVGSARGGGV